jgi:hypothetical protein
MRLRRFEPQIYNWYLVMVVSKLVHGVIPPAVGLGYKTALFVYLVLSQTHITLFYQFFLFLSKSRSVALSFLPDCKSRGVSYTEERCARNSCTLKRSDFQILASLTFCFSNLKCSRSWIKTQKYKRDNFSFQSVLSKKTNKCGAQFQKVRVGPGAVWPCVETWKSLSPIGFSDLERSGP